MEDVFCEFSEVSVCGTGTGAKREELEEREENASNKVVTEPVVSDVRGWEDNHRLLVFVFLKDAQVCINHPFEIGAKQDNSGVSSGITLDWKHPLHRIRIFLIIFVQ
jgi:hypothetical protein